MKIDVKSEHGMGWFIAIIFGGAIIVAMMRDFWGTLEGVVALAFIYLLVYIGYRAGRSKDIENTI
ncbi:hypothetical protein M1295_01510 [Patescibacteria group bacterium]|nr:hypothetical protein [Patescibacteria group bacterium]